MLTTDNHRKIPSLSFVLNASKLVQDTQFDPNNRRNSTEYKSIEITHL